MIGFSPHNAIYFMMSQKRDVTFSKTSKLIVYMATYMLSFQKENR